MLSKLYVTILTFVLATFQCLATETQGDLRWNPLPAPDDLIIPLPGDGQVVFRPILVIGGSFWGDADRIVQIGSATGEMFETPERRMIAGSFPVPGGKDQVIYLGKYELTKAQVALILGDGNVSEGFKRFGDLSGDKSDIGLVGLTRADTKQAQARPAAWLEWATWQMIIDKFNRWCFTQKFCLDRLPRNGDVPGYFRLPTELEWEYAARGGVDSMKTSDGARRFDDRLPFSPNDWQKYAWASPVSHSKTTRIGRFLPTFGLYDIFGNVQELVSDPFRPEFGNGKGGALTARGGSFLTSGSELRSALRTEVPVYEWTGEAMRPARSPTTGVRLAIGSPVLFRPEVLTELSREYAAYRKDVQKQMPSFDSMRDGLVQASGPIAEIESIIASSDNSDSLFGRRGEIIGWLNEAKSILEIRSQEAMLSAARLGLTALRDWDELESLLDRNQRVLELLKKRADGDSQRTERINRVVNDSSAISIKSLEAAQAFGNYLTQISRFDQQQVEWLKEKLESWKTEDKRTRYIDVFVTSLVPSDTNWGDSTVVQEYLEKALQRSVEE